MADIEKKIDSLVSTLLEDLEGGKDIDKELSFDHPDKNEIIGIIEELKEIMFPGFFHSSDLKVYTKRNNLAMKVEDVLYKLTKQISLVLGQSVEDVKEREEKAANIALEFMEKIPTLREYLDTDVEAILQGDPAAYNKDEIVISYPGFYATFIYRIAHELFLLKVPLIPRVMTEHAHSVTGIDIHPGATIGKYFAIDHGTGIVIGETTEIGNWVKIYQGVTLGALSTRAGQKLKDKKRHPTIHDNVTIYSGASVLGGETDIGANVVIGGNAFITHSIPEGTKVSISNQELSFKYDSNNPDNNVKVDSIETFDYSI